MVTQKHTHTVVLYTVTITRHTVSSLLLHWPSSFTVTLGPKLSAAKYTQAMNVIFTSSPSPSPVPVCEKVRRAKRGKLRFSAFLIVWAKFSRALRNFANQCLKSQKGHKLFYAHNSPHKKHCGDTIMVSDGYTVVL